MKRKKMEQMRAFNLISSLMFDLDTNEDKRISRQEMEAGANNDQLHELLQRVDFPHGFTFAEFHAMLDQDGSGQLSRREFINGLLRLVYNDQFQRDCMFQLTMGQIKANQCKLHREMKSHIHQLFAGIKREIDILRTDVRSNNLPRSATSATTLSQENDISLGLKSFFSVGDQTYALIKSRSDIPEGTEASLQGDWQPLPTEVDLHSLPLEVQGSKRPEGSGSAEGSGGQHLRGAPDANSADLADQEVDVDALQNPDGRARNMNDSASPRGKDTRRQGAPGRRLHGSHGHKADVPNEGDADQPVNSIEAI